MIMEDKIKDIIDKLLDQRKLLIETLTPKIIDNNSYNFQHNNQHYDSSMINTEVNKIDCRIDLLLKKLK